MEGGVFAMAPAEHQSQIYSCMLSTKYHVKNLVACLFAQWSGVQSEKIEPSVAQGLLGSEFYR